MTKCNECGQEKPDPDYGLPRDTYGQPIKMEHVLLMITPKVTEMSGAVTVVMRSQLLIQRQRDWDAITESGQLICMDYHTGNEYRFDFYPTGNLDHVVTLNKSLSDMQAHGGGHV